MCVTAMFVTYILVQIRVTARQGFQSDSLSDFYLLLIKVRLITSGSSILTIPLTRHGKQVSPNLKWRRILPWWDLYDK